MKRISIIIPCYNCSNYIRDTVRSAISQTLDEWEIIAVNDGSDDASGDLLDDLAHNHERLRVIHQSNLGVCSARNAGYEASSESEYLLFLDADDRLKPTMLEETTHYLDKNPGVGLVHTDYELINQSGEPLSKKVEITRYASGNPGIIALSETDSETPFCSVYTLCPIIPSVSVLRRSVFKSTPGWDVDFGQGFEDTDLFLQIALRSDVHFLPNKLVQHRRHDSNHSSNRAIHHKQVKKLYQKWRRLEESEPQFGDTIRQARIFKDRKLRPYQGLKKGVNFVSGGKILKGLRFIGGAAKRFILSFI